MKKLAKDAENIEFKGFQTGEALRKFVKSSRCVVMPSACYENGPYSAMEAMALGKPLIVSNCGGLPELVEDGVNGYIYEKTADALAECIEKMQKLDSKTYQKMANASLTKANALFSADGYIAEIEKQYRNIRETDNGR